MASFIIYYKSMFACLKFSSLTLSAMIFMLFLGGCFESTVFSEKELDSVRMELEYNHWLLSVFYLYQEDLGEVADYSDVDALYLGLSDPYTHYFPPEEQEKVLAQYLETPSPGILGFQYSIVGNDKDSIIVHRILPDSPAEESKLEKGDIILKANDVRISGENSADSLYREATRGDSGTVVILTLQRENETIVDTLIKRLVALPSVYADVDSGMGVITLLGFVEQSYDTLDTHGEFLKALETLADYDTLILDVRGNPGGSVKQCVDIANEIVGDGLIITRIEHSMDDATLEAYVDTLNYEGTMGGQGENRTWMLLTDGGSASCSEILASAMRDAGLPSTGSTTYGKGVGQVLLPTWAEGLAVITSLEFRNTAGESYHQKGLVPDHQTAEGQDALELAVEILRGKISLEKRASGRTAKRLGGLPRFDFPGGAYLHVQRP